MATLLDSDVDQDWDDTESDDDEESEVDMSDDDDLEMEDFEEDVEFDVAENEPAPGRRIPVWRLIEMSREDRFLKSELADFEDYDIDDYDGHRNSLSF